MAPRFPWCPVNRQSLRKKQTNKKIISYCEIFASWPHLPLRLWSCKVVLFWQESKPIQINYLQRKHKLPKSVLVFLFFFFQFLNCLTNLFDNYSSHCQLKIKFTSLQYLKIILVKSCFNPPFNTFPLIFIFLKIFHSFCHIFLTFEI